MTKTVATTKTIRELIEDVEKADSARALVDAVAILAQKRDPEAIPALTQVLAFNNPGAAVAAVDGLIAIGQESVPYLLSNLDGYNYGARAWTIRVLAGIGDPRALDLLLEAATGDFSLSVRRAAARGLGSIKWNQLPLTARAEAQARALDALLLVCHDGEWIVRYAAIVGLEQLYQAFSQSDRAAITSRAMEGTEQISTKLSQMCEDDLEITLRARAKLALEAIAHQ